MNRLPFEALVDGTGRNVIESYTVSYAPSATAFHILRSRRPSVRATLPLLAVAAASPTASDDPKDTVAVKRSVPPGIFDTSVSELPALPAARREVRQIADAMGPQSVVLVGGDGSESAVKAQPLSRYRVLHFATHGLVSSRYPDRSALILDADANEDGFLQAREIGHMQLNAELVTLTACDAGAGRITGQEGVANLVRPFLVSGARSVMANLWQVNDEFSRSLMKEFYSRLAAGAEKAGALREAKLELIRRYGKDARPDMWAGFILVGDNRGVVSGGQRQ
jgi:CHAT domain-containing protein